LVVTPADQTVVDVGAFTAATQIAIEKATDGGIVILGVTPSQPKTGYGYIHAEAGGGSAGATDSVHSVKRFVEKPNVTTAQEYLAEGGYFWNAGMFVLKASVWLNALQHFRPDIYRATHHAWNLRSSDSNPSAPFVRPGKAEFIVVPAESVD
jgi:mannose-1-phosphate guanylyltransferase/mannose-6-phosphate isomerase